MLSTRKLNRGSTVPSQASASNESNVGPSLGGGFAEYQTSNFDAGPSTDLVTTQAQAQTKYWFRTRHGPSRLPNPGCGLWRRAHLRPGRLRRCRRGTCGSWSGPAKGRRSYNDWPRPGKTQLVRLSNVETVDWFLSMEVQSGWYFVRAD